MITGMTETLIDKYDFILMILIYLSVMFSGLYLHGMTVEKMIQTETKKIKQYTEANNSDKARKIAENNAFLLLMHYAVYSLCEFIYFFFGVLQMFYLCKVVKMTGLSAVSIQFILDIPILIHAILFTGETIFVKVYCCILMYWIRFEESRE